MAFSGFSIRSSKIKLTVVVENRIILFLRIGAYEFSGVSERHNDVKFCILICITYEF